MGPQDDGQIGGKTEKVEEEEKEDKGERMRWSRKDKVSR